MMPALSPDQRRTRERVEAAIRVAAPALDLVLAAGERLARVVQPDDPGYYPARPAGGEPPPPIPRGERPE